MHNRHHIPFLAAILELFQLLSQPVVKAGMIETVKCFALDLL